jgi:hypothetical protein
MMMTSLQGKSGPHARPASSAQFLLPLPHSHREVSLNTLHQLPPLAMFDVPLPRTIISW